MASPLGLAATRGALAHARKPATTSPCSAHRGLPRARMPAVPKLLLPGFDTKTSSGFIVQTDSSITLSGASYDGGMRGVAHHRTPITDAPLRPWMLEATSNRSGADSAPYPTYEIGVSAYRAIDQLPFGGGFGANLFIGNGSTFAFGLPSTRTTGRDVHISENMLTPGYQWGFANKTFRLQHVGRRLVRCWASHDGGLAWTLFGQGWWAAMPNLLYPYAAMRSDGDGWKNIKLWIGN